ncbi:MAG: hypothetical protein PWP23_622 [Candidatus Sumerlaeota bacterium]|nr:hypothetical protein [Candidatus Sumerlaeota bacterium]
MKIPRGGKARYRFLAVAAAMLLLLAACATQPGPSLPPGFEMVEPPEPLAPRFEKMRTEGVRNWVLNLQELAVDALYLGDRDLATMALDEAIVQIEVIYGDSEQARLARSAFYKENSKIFKGDPYERSMTYFLRGVLYMQDREWDNARACFRSAAFMDAFAEDEQHKADWALFDYLIGVCEVRLGDASSADDAFKRAAGTYSRFAESYEALSAPLGIGGKSRLAGFAELPDFTRQDNLLVLTLQGYAPRKVGVGRFGEYIGIEPGGGVAGPPKVRVGSRQPELVRTVDSVYYQAVTRGGRELDRILGRQAQFKGTAEDAGEVSTHLGVWAMGAGLEGHNKDVVAAGALLTLLGIASYGVASTVQPEADTRYWGNLPDALGMYRTAYPAGEIPVEIVFPGGGAVKKETALIQTLHLEENELCVVLAIEYPGPFACLPPGAAVTAAEPAAEPLPTATY